MGILRTKKISGLETPTPVTGSVVLGGPSSGDYLDLSSPEFAIGNADFTIETWYNLASYPTNYYLFDLHTGGNGIRFQFYDGGTAGQVKTYWTTSTGTFYSSAVNQFTELNRWYHMSMTRKATTVYAFMDGILQGTFTVADNFAHTNLRIGSYGSGSSQGWNGYISNFRILKGTALYTANFTPPVNELQRIRDTVLLCCNNPDSAGAEATGKTITVNGNAAASTFSPGLTRDFTFGTQFEGVGKFDTQGYFVPPSGTTEQRGRGRGVFMAGTTTPILSATPVNTIDFISMQSTGSATDFGDLTATRTSPASGSSSTRVLCAGSYDPAPTNKDVIDYITIATQSNATSFGTLSVARGEFSGVSSPTRAVFGGGTSGSTTIRNTLDYVTISSLGSAITFGSLFTGRYCPAAASSNTRGLFAGGQAPSPTGVCNIIEYITIASTGNSVDFGDLTETARRGAGVSSPTRAVFGGNAVGATNTLAFVIIATLGNAQDFGDLTSSRGFVASVSSSSRGVFGGGTPTANNIMDYITITSTGNALDFGDLSQSRTGMAGASDSHGGIS